MHSVVDSCVDTFVRLFAVRCIWPSDAEQEHRHRMYFVLSLKLKMLE